MIGVCTRLIGVRRPWPRCPYRRWFASSSGSGKPVVIVGAGPVGSTLALLLARYNIKSVVVEKQNKQDLVSHPRAHVVNSRTLEIIRGVSDPRDQLIERVMSSVHKMSTWDKFIYASSICGTHLGTTHHFPVGKDERQRVLQQWRDLISPYHVVNLPQSTLQGLLLDEMAKYPELIELHTETEFCKYNYLENSKGLQVHFNRVDGSGDGMRIDCSFVVGCDGASSKVRREAGLRLQGDPEKQHFLNIEFKITDFTRLLPNAVPAMIYFIYHKKIICCWVAHDWEQGHFVMQIPYFPPYQTPEGFSDQWVKDMIVQSCGREIIRDKITLLSRKAWKMAAVNADSYHQEHPYGSNEPPRVFLAGDAAHQCPPTGGFGLNTGMYDVHNLAWKLAMTMDQAKKVMPTLLRTYSRERRHYAQQNIQLSERNFQKVVRVSSALGVPAEGAGPLLQSFDLPPLKWAPMAVKRTMLENLLSVARAQLAVAESPSNPFFDNAKVAVAQIFNNYMDLQLFFPAHDLGVCYRSRCVVGAENQHLRALDETKEFQPTLELGCRFPHMWLHVVERSSADSSPTVSTLDVVRDSGLRFTLFTSPSSVWALIPGGDEIVVARIDDSNPPSASSSEVGFDYADFSCRWADINASVKAVLVRPDGHVCWLAKEDPVSLTDAIKTLENVLDQLLGRK